MGRVYNQIIILSIFKTMLAIKSFRILLHATPTSKFSGLQWELICKQTLKHYLSFFIGSSSFHLATTLRPLATINFISIPPISLVSCLIINNLFSITYIPTSAVKMAWSGKGGVITYLPLPFFNFHIHSTFTL